MFGWLHRAHSGIARRFVDRVHAVAPGVEARITARDTVVLQGAEGARAVCSLDSLAAAIAMPGGDVDVLLRRHVDTALALLRPLPETIDAAAVLPMLKPAGWARSACEVASERPHARDVASGLECVLVEEIDRRLRFVAERHCIASGLAARDLHDRAFANLKTLAPAASIATTEEKGIRLVNLGTRPSLNATLALVPAIWRQVADAFDCDECVCAIPERDYCLFARAQDVGAIDALRGDFVPSLHECGAYPVSRSLWRFVDGHMVPLAR